MRPAPDNRLGLTGIASYDDMINARTLADQLTDQGVTYVGFEVPDISGMGGNAEVLTYISPKVGRPVTVLIVPSQYDVDRYAEDYFYFEGLDAGEAAEMDWVATYDACRELAAREN